jgi:hypothetical protein
VFENQDTQLLKHTMNYNPPKICTLNDKTYLQQVYDDFRLRNYPEKISLFEELNKFVVI